MTYGLIRSTPMLAQELWAQDKKVQSGFALLMSTGIRIALLPLVLLDVILSTIDVITSITPFKTSFTKEREESEEKPCNEDLEDLKEDLVFTGNWFVWGAAIIAIQAHNLKQTNPNPVNKTEVPTQQLQKRTTSVPAGKSTQPSISAKNNTYWVDFTAKQAQLTQSKTFTASI